MYPYRTLWRVAEEEGLAWMLLRWTTALRPPKSMPGIYASHRAKISILSSTTPLPGVAMSLAFRQFWTNVEILFGLCPTNNY